ncbi:MAG: hypothetical protein ACLFTJ_10770 [Halothece sp.]
MKASYSLLATETVALRKLIGMTISVVSSDKTLGWFAVTIKLSRSRF